jgi:transcriptional regulator with XRE-family HTH domain
MRVTWSPNAAVLATATIGRMSADTQWRRRFGRRVRGRREELRLTQVALAEVLGLDDSTVRAIEAGRRLPSVDVLRNLAKALDTRVGTLLDEPLPGGTAADEAAGIIGGMNKGWQGTTLEILRALHRQSRRG